MSLKKLRWDVLTHASARAYRFRSSFVMEPLKRLAELTPWFDAPASEAYVIGLEAIWSRYLGGATVLDVGCGPGSFRRDVLDRYGGLSYAGIDVSPGMIEAAKRAFPHDLFHVGSAHALPFGDATYDVVAARFLFHHIAVAERGPCLMELLRVARRCAIIQDVYGFPSGGVRKLYETYYRVADGSYYRDTLEEWSRMFASHGTRVVEQVDSGPRTIVRRMAGWVLERR